MAAAPAVITSPASEFGSLDTEALKGRLTTLAKAEQVEDIKANIYEEVDHASNAILEDMKAPSLSAEQKAELSSRIRLLSEVRTVLSDKLDVAVKQAVADLSRLDPVFKLLLKDANSPSAIIEALLEKLPQGGLAAMFESEVLQNPATLRAVIIVAEAIHRRSPNSAVVVINNEASKLTEEQRSMLPNWVMVIEQGSYDATLNELLSQGKQVVVASLSKNSEHFFKGKKDNLTYVNVKSPQNIGEVISGFRVWIAGLIKGDNSFRELLAKEGLSKEDIDSMLNPDSQEGAFSVNPVKFNVEDLDALQKALFVLEQT